MFRSASESTDSCGGINVKGTHSTGLPLVWRTGVIRNLEKIDDWLPLLPKLPILCRAMDIN